MGGGGFAGNLSIFVTGMCGWEVEEKNPIQKTSGAFFMSHSIKLQNHLNSVVFYALFRSLDEMMS